MNRHDGDHDDTHFDRYSCDHKYVETMMFVVASTGGREAKRNICCLLSKNVAACWITRLVGHSAVLIDGSFFCRFLFLFVFVFANSLFILGENLVGFFHTTKTTTTNRKHDQEEDDQRWFIID